MQSATSDPARRELQLLRAGKDPEMVRGALGRWQNILWEIKKLAGAL